MSYFVRKTNLFDQFSYIHDVFTVTGGYKSVLSIDLNSEHNQEQRVALPTALHNSRTRNSLKTSHTEPLPYVALATSRLNCHLFMDLSQ